MSDIAQSDILAFAPELSSGVSPTAWTAILLYVNSFDPSVFDEDDTGPSYYLSRCYLAAHLATVTRRAGSGAVGPLLAQSIGPIRRSYGSLDLGDIGALGSTPFGAAFASLLAMSTAALPLVSS